MEHIFLVLIIILIIIVVVLIFALLRSNTKNDNKNKDKIDFNKQSIARLEEQLAQLREYNASAESRFKVLANETLMQNAEQLQRSNSAELEKILGPMKMRMEDFNTHIKQTHTDAQASRQSLSDQISRLQQMNNTISQDARQLTEALKGNNRVQGQWGEMALAKILENSGLLKGVNYEMQVTHNQDGSIIHNDKGNDLRPDAVVYLPEGRAVIIDSKAVINAYLEYCNATDEQKRKEAAKDHATAIRNQIDNLAKKNYQQFYKGSMEHVFLFIPNDGAFILALNSFEGIIEYAAKKNISLISPSQLMSVLSLIKQLWRKDTQDKNVEEIALIGGQIYDSVVAFVKEMESIKASLAKATESYNNAFAKLSSNNQSVLKRAIRLKQCGAKTTKSLPLNILNDIEGSLSQ